MPAAATDLCNPWQPAPDIRWKHPQHQIVLPGVFVHKVLLVFNLSPTRHNLLWLQ
jgi:hypothetical protein